MNENKFIFSNKESYINNYLDSLVKIQEILKEILMNFLDFQKLQKKLN